MYPYMLQVRWKSIFFIHIINMYAFLISTNPSVTLCKTLRSHYIFFSCLVLIYICTKLTHKNIYVQKILSNLLKNYNL